MPKTLLQRIESFNAGRDPERLALKYAEMRKDSFGFLRGSCHLFYEDLPVSRLPKTPLIWCCGDLHLANFGTYKGDNRLTYFDINDFDEACLAPVSWDLVRLLASVTAAGHTLGITSGTVKTLGAAFLDRYRHSLAAGKARWLERATSEGMIRLLLLRVKKRRRKKFLASRTVFENGKRVLLIDGVKALPLRAGEFSMLQKFMVKFAKRQPDPAFFTLEDAARRIAGTGSLGLDRYVLLVTGRGGPYGHFLLDLKYQAGSSVIRKYRLRQPAWTNEAERVAITQQTVQAASPALLHSVEMDGRSWVLRELQPTADRLNIASWCDDVPGFEEAIQSLGEIVAWGHIRAAGRRGAAGVEELISFGSDTRWTGPLLKIAGGCGQQVIEQWQEFSRT